MANIMEVAHRFLQVFCLCNPQNQALLHKDINLFMTPGVRDNICTMQRHKKTNNFKIFEAVCDIAFQQYVNKAKGFHTQDMLVIVIQLDKLR